MDFPFELNWNIDIGEEYQSLYRLCACKLNQILIKVDQFHSQCRNMFRSQTQLYYLWIRSIWLDATNKFAALTYFVLIVYDAWKMRVFILIVSFISPFGRNSTACNHLKPNDTNKTTLNIWCSIVLNRLDNLFGNVGSVYDSRHIYFVVALLYRIYIICPSHFTRQFYLLQSAISVIVTQHGMNQTMRTEKNAYTDLLFYCTQFYRFFIISAIDE